MDALQKIQQKIDALRAEREQYINQANRTISYMNGSIDALEELLREMNAGEQVEATDGNS